MMFKSKSMLNDIERDACKKVAKKMKEVAYKSKGD